MLKDDTKIDVYDERGEFLHRFQGTRAAAKNTLIFLLENLRHGLTIQLDLPDDKHCRYVTEDGKRHQLPEELSEPEKRLSAGALWAIVQGTASHPVVGQATALAEIEIRLWATNPSDAIGGPARILTYGDQGRIVPFKLNDSREVFTGRYLQIVED